MDKDTNITKVIFRVDKKDKTVFALLPEIPADYDGWHHCDCYQHFGGHSGADYDFCIKYSRPALPQEYLGLKQEMENNYGYNIQVVKRCSSTMHDNFINAVRAGYDDKQ